MLRLVHTHGIESRNVTERWKIGESALEPAQFGGVEFMSPGIDGPSLRYPYRFRVSRCEDITPHRHRLDLGSTSYVASCSGIGGVMLFWAA